MLNVRIQFFLLFNTGFLTIFRFLLQEGITKQFLEVLIIFCFLLFMLIFSINLIKNKKVFFYYFIKVKEEYKNNKTFSFFYVSLLFTLIIFLENRIQQDNFSELILISSILLVFFGVYLIKILKLFRLKSVFSFNNNLDKTLVLIFLSLIPIFRYCVSNREILFNNEQFYLILYFAITSFLVIAIYSFIMDSIMKVSIFQIFNTSLLIFIYEMPSITYTYQWARVDNVEMLLGIFIIILTFIFLIHNSTTRQLSLFSILIFFISVLPNFISDDIEIDLVNISNNSVFSNSEYQSLKNNPSIILLVYDGYPQLETLENLNIDNSEHVEFLLENNFTIYNGIYSHGSYTLATMSGLFQGETDTYGEKNGRLITGGYSSFMNLLDRNNYFTAGIFTSSFYLPPTMEPNYNYYYPVSANRSNNIYTSMLRGKQSFKDLIYASPHENYLEEKRDFLNNIEEYNKPVFLYSHTYYPGHTQNSGECLEGEFNNWKKDLEKGNLEMQQDVQSLEKSFENSIIILIGDHGPFLTKNCTSLHDYPSNEINRLDIQDRHGTFVAIRTPDSQKINFDKKILQNLFIYVYSYINNEEEILRFINSENIHNSHLPASINVLENIIQGGIDDGKVLFKNRSDLRK